MPVVGELGDRFPELSELLDDMAVFMLPRAGGEIPYVSPRRKGGGSYVTPNSGCVQ